MNARRSTYDYNDCIMKCDNEITAYQACIGARSISEAQEGRAPHRILKEEFDASQESFHSLRYRSTGHSDS